MLNFIGKLILLPDTEFASMNGKPDVPQGFDKWEEVDIYFVYTDAYFFSE